MKIDYLFGFKHLDFDYMKGHVALNNPTKTGSEVLHKENTPYDEYYVYGHKSIEDGWSIKDGYGLKHMKLFNGVPTIIEDYHTPTEEERTSKYCLCRLA